MGCKFAASLLMGLGFILLQDMAAEGGVGIASGNLHARADIAAYTSPTTLSHLSDAPPDKPFVWPSTSQQAHKEQSGVDADVAHTISQSANRITLDASGGADSFDSPFGPGQTASAHANGVVTLIEDVTESGSASFPITSNYYCTGAVSLYDASHTRLSLLGSGGGSQAFTLTPGQYTLEWNVDCGIAVGTWGSSNYQFAMTMVPEPVSLSLLVIPVLLSRRRRRGLRTM